MAATLLQVVQQRRNHSRKNEKQGSGGREEGPIPPGHVEGRLIEAAKHGRPEVALEFVAANGAQGILQRSFDVVKFVLIHASTPCCESGFLNTRTPRKRR